MTRPPKRDIIAAVVCLGLAAAALLGVCATTLFRESIWWSDSAIASSRAAGDRIIAAIERYRIDHGAYPERLESLVPEYVAALGRPAAGERCWRYDADGDESFTLSFAYDELGYPICYWESLRGAWWEDR